MDLFQTIIDDSQAGDLIYCFRQNGSVDQVIRVKKTDITGTKITTGTVNPVVQTTTNENDLYINTTTGSLYEFDGTEWEYLATFSGPTGTSIKSITVNDDLTFTFLMSDGSTIISKSNIYVNDEGYLISPSETGTLPDDFTTNGGIYIAPADYVSGTKQLPTGLYLNGDVVMTDGTVYFINTVNNNNVLCTK